METSELIDEGRESSVERRVNKMWSNPNAYYQLNLKQNGVSSTSVIRADYRVHRLPRHTVTHHVSLQ